jgi:hypothetical protein
VDCALKPNLSPEEDDTLRSLFNLMVNRSRFGSFRIAIRLIVHLNSLDGLVSFRLARFTFRRVSAIRLILGARLSCEETATH